MVAIKSVGGLAGKSLVLAPLKLGVGVLAGGALAPLAGLTLLGAAIMIAKQRRRLPAQTHEGFSGKNNRPKIPTSDLWGSFKKAVSGLANRASDLEDVVSRTGMEKIPLEYPLESTWHSVQGAVAELAEHASHLEDAISHIGMKQIPVEYPLESTWLSVKGMVSRWVAEANSN